MGEKKEVEEFMHKTFMKESQTQHIRVKRMDTENFTSKFKVTPGQIDKKKILSTKYRMYS